MRTKLLIMGTLATVVLFAGACSAALGSPKQAKVNVGYDEFMQDKHISKQVDVTTGSEIIVELASNPSTGFTWTEATVGDPALVTQVETKYVAPEAGTVGAAGRQVWTFKASGTGSTTVKMAYSRPWVGGEQSEWTFELIVNAK